MQSSEHWLSIITLLAWLPATLPLTPTPAAAVQGSLLACGLCLWPQKPQTLTSLQTHRLTLNSGHTPPRHTTNLCPKS